MDPTRVEQSPRITRLPEPALEVAALAADLRACVRGEVRFEPGSRAMYAHDASNYRLVPLGVVVPRDAGDVVAAVAACRRHQAPLVARGGGTSLAGQCCNVAVVLDFSKYMHHLCELDPLARQARVQPGIILDRLRDEAERHHLTFGPDPATHNHCTLGGMIGNDACGIHAQMAGRTSSNVRELEILTYDGCRMRVQSGYSEQEISRIVAEGGRKGEIFAALRHLRDRYAPLIRARFPRIPRLVSGYGLQYLLPEHGFNVAAALVGSEGTCVTVLEATLKLVPSPPKRALVVLAYQDVYLAADHVPRILEFGPLALEGLDDKLVDFMELKGLHGKNLELMPEGKGWLLVEFGGESQEEATRKADEMLAALGREPRPPAARRFEDPARMREIWEIRESGLGATAFVPGMPSTWPGWEDSAVPPERMGDYMRDLRALFDRYDYHPALYGHFGQGCVHCRVDFDLESAPGLAHYRSFVEEAARLCVRYGGSLSGEHGDGQARSELLPIMFGPELIQAFGEFKALWDPAGRMNPGRLVDPRPLTGDLKLGAGYAPPQLVTHFKFPDDHGSFAHATLRCVGVGKCRRTEGGTMCPSYMVTHEEYDTTRGRARTLFEMLQGDVLKGGWQDEHVKEALHLCLACKGCKSECPVNVDIATYKAEFFSHYYRRKLRPRAAYSMGLIFRWARLASYLPRVANFVTQTPGLRAAAKWLGGIAPERRLPPFATETFKEWFRRRAVCNQGAERVLLWPDTFTNHFNPEIGKATVEVLEAAGFQVLIPEAALCCGRPLYDFGMLDSAERLLKQILASLKPMIDQGVPLVGMEPSCVAVFRDELTNLFPEDEDAKRLRDSSYLFSEFMQRHAPDLEFPRLDRQAVVHGHCHHKALMKLHDEERLLDRLGLDYRVLDSGCCGMAGSFGFEPDKVDVSIKAGERVLLPAVRAADPAALIVTDGFSCREQIAQLSERRPMHVAELARMALRQGREAPMERAPRRPALGEYLLLAGGAALVVGLITWRVRGRT